MSLSPQQHAMRSPMPEPLECSQLLGIDIDVVDYMDTSPIDPPPAFKFDELLSALEAMDTST